MGIWVWKEAERKIERETNREKKEGQINEQQYKSRLIDKEKDNK